LVPRSRLDLGISARPCGFSPIRRPPQTCVYGFILPRASRLLQSFDKRPALPACAFRAPPLEFPSLIAAPACGVHSCPETQPPSFVPSSAFRTPSTVSSATCLAGLFHPAATSRVCPPGVCPSPRSRTGFPRPFHALLPFRALAFDQLERRRLQGLAPRGECGVASGCLDPLRSAPLLGFSSSSGSSPPAWYERLHAHSALDLRLDEPAKAGPLRFTHASFGFPGTRLPTRSRLSGLNPCSPFEAQVRGLRTW